MSGYVGHWCGGLPRRDVDVLGCCPALRVVFVRLQGKREGERERATETGQIDNQTKSLPALPPGARTPFQGAQIENRFLGAFVRHIHLLAAVQHARLLLLSGHGCCPSPAPLTREFQIVFVTVKVLFKQFFSTAIMGLGHGLVPLPVLLSLVGPDSHRFAKVCTLVSICAFLGY